MMSLFSQGRREAKSSLKRMPKMAPLDPSIDIGDPPWICRLKRLPLRLSLTPVLYFQHGE